jgi:hypothetical protein
LLEETSELCYREIKDIKCITCPHKPEGSMFVMVRNFVNFINMKKEPQKLRIVSEQLAPEWYILMVPFY